MTMCKLSGLWLLSLVLAFAAASAAASAEAEVQSSYIVHVAPGHAPRSSRPRLLSRAYTSFLRNQLPTHLQQPEPRLLYSYAHAATGFAAGLTRDQADHLASLPSVLAVVPDVLYEPHTTLTPSFLGLSSAEPGGLLPASNAASDVVIGVIDTGVYPKDRASFAAHPSLTPPPAKFRGGCVSAPSFNASAYCNNKLVGAKFFSAGYEFEYGPIDEAHKSPLDTNGHGTHTASTAAGSAVTDAGFFDYARGKAIGMAPGARIAAYKVLWEKGGTSTDILAAFDEAISDGVDVISVSLGPRGKAAEFRVDDTAVGAFRAVRKGILVSASAGNSGPDEFTAANIAPWFLTVGASTINRQFQANVVLGNGKNFTGTSLYAGAPLGPSQIPLVYGGDVGSEVCEPGKLNASMVAGKIVFCFDVAAAIQGEAVKLAGGAGAILGSYEEFGDSDTAAHVLPATAVPLAATREILKYIETNASPTATIVFQGTVISKALSSPRMAAFSSRGPNLWAPEILKPDVTAPGVEILAAWTGENSPSSELDSDTRRVKFNIISGTSMSCPHVSGIAALLRQARPEWSPAAIKSALMTTAYNVDNAGDIIKDMSTGEASTPFVRGASHVDPNRALNPGLVYDAGTDDYVSFLCALGYNATEIAVFTADGSVTDCSTLSGAVDHLNYPAFSVVVGSGRYEVTQRRVVRNVGRNVTATYTASIASPAGVRVSVEPLTLEFSATQKTQEYTITFAAEEGSVLEKYTFGSIVWSDGEHKVRSPIAIIWLASQQSQQQQVAAM